MEFKKGDIYGTHRVIEPKGVLPQPADIVDNNMEIYDNEVLIDVHTLNICLLYTSSRELFLRRNLQDSGAEWT